MKIFVKRNDKMDLIKNTIPGDILLAIPTEVEQHKNDSNLAIPKKPKKTHLSPYNIMREMVINEQLLEGRVEKEVEEKKEGDDENGKPKESNRKKDEEGNEQEQNNEDDDEKNPYLEKFKYSYLSDIITTGTVSIVVKTNNIESMMKIQNPWAIEYGNIMLDDGDSEIEDIQPKVNISKKTALRRNDTILPGGLARQITNLSKALVKKQTKSKNTNRVFNSKSLKKKGRELEEITDDVILKKIILDIPPTSRFYQREYIDNYNKEQEEEMKLDENNDEEEEEALESDSEDEVDIFLDRDINFDKEIKKAANDSAKRKNDRVDWSGQDIKNDYDPYFAMSAADLMSSWKIYPKGIFGKLVKLRFYIFMLVTSSFFDNFMTLAVAFNTVILSLDRYNIPTDQEATLAVMNSYFTYIFISELGLKVIGLGPIAYLKDKMNYLDATVVLLSVVELAFMSGGGALSAFKAVRIMRTFRVLRVARLLKSMKSMQIIMNVISRSFNSILYLAMLLLLFLFIYALLGMQVFGGNLAFSDGTPRCNFDSFNLAFVWVFQLLTIENWQSVMYTFMRSNVNNIITIIYLLSWIFIGNYMLLNLFLAILLDSFSDEDEALSSKKSPEEIKQEAEDAKNEFYSKTGESLILDYTDLVIYSKGVKSSAGAFVKTAKKKVKDDKLMDESFELDETAIKTKLQNEIKAKKPDYWGVMWNRSLYIFHYNNIIRKICYKVSNHFLFENLVMLIIVCSSIKLAYDTYITNLPSDNIQQVISTDLDTFFTFFFAFEALLKIVALGFIQDEGSYLRESWNQLDFFIVCASLIDFSVSSIDIPVIRVLRILRTLRPLRFISHNSEMKLIVTALLESVGHIINILIVIVMIWLMFGILAVNLFAGKLFYCSVDTYSISTADEWRLVNGDWQVYSVNYDNVIIAIQNLFVLTTLEAWPDFMWEAVDGSGVDAGPQQAAVPYASYFFIVTIFVWTFFFLNFFVGVIFMNYEEAQKSEKESWLMTKRELEWVDIMKMIVKAKPDLETTNVPNNRILKKLHHFVTCTPFEIVIMVVIVLNMIQMGMTYEGDSDLYELALTYINYAFTGIFVIEMLLKWTAFGFSYFSSRWNVFDWIVVFGSILDIVMSNMNASQLTFLRVGPQLIRVLRVMRVSRLIRLINKHPGLQALLKTIMFSLPSLLSVFTLLMLAFFIYAVLGWFLFGGVTKGIIIDEFKNFFDFGNAMLLWIRVSTGEDWPYIMYDYNNTSSDCISGKTWGTPFSPIFFITNQVIWVFIMLNLFVLVILQQFDQYYLAEDNIIAKFEKDQQIFKNAWTEFATANRWVKMKDNKLLAFFKSMEVPLGMEKEVLNNDNDYNKNIVQMDIRADEEGYVYFNELLYKVMRKAYGVKHIRNKKLAEHEANTFMKINKIQEKMSKFLISEEKKAISVNPFLAMMYYNISFKTWMNVTRKTMETELKNQNIYGSEDSNDAFSESQKESDNEVEVSEYSFKTYNLESIHSDSSSMSKKSEEYSDSGSGYETITEHEAEENDKDNPDASFEKQKGRRLMFNEDEVKENGENKIYSSEKDIIKIEEIENSQIDEESSDYNESPKR